MKILWDLEKALIREIVEQYEDPRPAYTTVATMVNILEKKGFVGREPVANSYCYYPLIRRTEYTGQVMKNFVQSYFSNSYKRLVSEFSSQGNLTTEEMEDLISELQKEVKKKNKN